MTTVFSRTLAELRKDAGFRTAYSFFYNNGGAAVFKVSYCMYLQFERGLRMPQFGVLGTYLYALHLVPKSSEAARFIQSWLITSLGEENFQQLIVPLLKNPVLESISGALHTAIQHSLREKKIYIKPEQLSVIVESPETHLCWMLLSNDSGTWSPEQLAKAAGLATARAERSLNNLTKAKLLTRRNGPTYKCPYAGAMLEFPHAMNCVKLSNKLNHMKDALFSSAGMVYRRRGTVRASLAQLANVLPLLSLNISTAEIYSTTEKCQDSGLFMLECVVKQIRKF